MMADGSPAAPPARSSRSPEEEERTGVGEVALTESQRKVLDRCLHALRHAENDSQTLAALLLITRLCPANQLDRPTLRRIFEAVGLDLPARLLVTVVRGTGSSGLPSQDLVSLGTALLAALSTDPDLTSHPQLLSTVPLLLGIVSNGLVQNQAGCGSETEDNESGGSAGDSGSDPNRSTTIQDEATAADCYQVLMAVCGLPKGPDQLLSRGTIPALCQAVDQNRTLSHQRGLALLGALLSDRTKEKAWSKHPEELLALLLRLSRDFCRASDLTRLRMCTQLVRFLPPSGAAPKSEELRRSVIQVWGALRPLLQAKLTPRQIGSVLVLSACLLDLYGWEPVGPPKFCCLLVNRACVEVRMGLEEPPGTDLSPELQQTLTGCFRIMEAAVEQACTEGDAAPPPASPPAALSLQQSQQVLRVLEEAFSAVMFYLQQVDPSRYDDPFVFATFRSLCSWLAEETSCLKQEVTRLLPFLIGYVRRHLQAVSSERGLSDWMAKISVSKEGRAWTGQEALRYLLPALCHLSAEEGPRKVLLTLETPVLLVDFLLQTWPSVKGRSHTTRDPSMETACSTLLNFTITEPESVGKDTCFRTLETHLSEALPVLVNKPRLLVLAANYVTLGLMIGRLRPPPSGPVQAAQRRFFSSAVRFLRGALRSGSCPGPVQVSLLWEQDWDEAAELWRLSLQVLAGCVRVQPWIVGPIRDEGWFAHTLSTLSECSALPDQNTREVLEQVLCAVVERCPVCEQEVRDVMKRSDEGALCTMTHLKEAVGQK